jgi:hypothetical protein
MFSDDTEAMLNATLDAQAHAEADAYCKANPLTDAELEALFGDDAEPSDDISAEDMLIIFDVE